MKLEQVLPRLIEGARQASQADAAAVCLLDEQGARLTVAAASGLPAAFWQREPVVVEHNPLDGETLAGQPTIVVDARTDPRGVSVPEGYCSVLCVPLMHEGNPVGTLHIYATAPQHFNDEHATLLMPLACLGAAVIAAVRTLASLEALEANKACFIHIVAHELRSPVTVMQSLMQGVLKGYAGELTDEQLDNLVSNAVKYTPPGGGVTVTVRWVDGQAQVGAADAGIGIPEEALSHLFEPFYRATNAKALEEIGTGLGLTIVKDLVGRGGGGIEVESTVGQGTTFTVTFPIHGLRGDVPSMLPQGKGS